MKRITVFFLFVVALCSMGAPVAQAQVEIAPPPTSVSLPADEAPHRNIVENWYFNGHLTGVDSHGKIHQYGYVFVIGQVYTGGTTATYVSHFTLTDATRKTYTYNTGMTVAPIPTTLNLSVNSWTISGGSGSYKVAAGFSDNSYSMNLSMISLIPPAIYNGNGIISYPSGLISAYYSYTLLNTCGTIVDHGETIKVTGTSWQDRQWENPPKGELFAWNWFSIQLSNNVQYMFYFMQDASGKIVKIVGAKIANKVTSMIPADKASLSFLSYWTSPASGVTYPTKWKLQTPDGTFTITSVMQNQELNQTTFCEADATVSGTYNGIPVTGSTYVEVGTQTF